MIVQTTPTISACLAAMLVAGAIVLAATGDAYATKVTRGPCHKITLITCDSPRGHPPTGGRCHRVTHPFC